MEKELSQIKEKIVRQITLMTLLSITPAYVASIIRCVESDWNQVFFVHSVLYVMFLGFTLYRNSFSIAFQINFIAAIYTVIGVSGLYFFGFNGSHYYLVFTVVILSILYKKSKVFQYLVFVFLLYVTIGLLYLFRYISPQMDIIGSTHSIKQWIIVISSVVSLSIAFVYGFGHFYHSLIEIIKKKQSVESELLQHQKELEETVKRRTEKLQLVNNELVTKSDLISKKNKELKKTLANLQETQDQLLRAEKMASLGTLTAGVAHEINNPLNYIMGAYVGLENYFDEKGSDEPEKVDVLLSSIKTGIDRTSNIVKGLNQFSRNNSSFDEDCDVHSIIDNCLVILNNRLKHQCVISKNYTDTDLIVIGNVGKLHQVIINILSNALDAVDENCLINIETAVVDDKVQIHIVDNGCGIKEENMSKVIDPFYTTKPPGKGTGLGLAISYSIVKEHKGIITIESEINKGTRVIIELPIK